MRFAHAIRSYSCCQQYTSYTIVQNLTYAGPLCLVGSHRSTDACGHGNLASFRKQNTI